MEDLFRGAGSKQMGRPFKMAGRAGWPYLNIEKLDFRHRRDIEDSNNLLSVIRLDKELRRVLDRGVWVGDKNGTLKDDVEKRAGHTDKTADFCELAESDLPRSICEGSSLNVNVPAGGTGTTDVDRTKHSLASRPAFEDAFLARNPFRTFHRNDGKASIRPIPGFSLKLTELRRLFVDNVAGCRRRLPEQRVALLLAKRAALQLR